MTLAEAKDQIARKYDYTDWAHMMTEWDGRTSLNDEAAELYARSKWDEACLATRLDDGRFIFSGVSPSEIDQDFYARPRLNFKP